MNEDEPRGDASSAGEQNSSGKLDSSGESVAEERLLRNAEPREGTEVPLPPEDETPLEIPPELIREEVREAQEAQLAQGNGTGPQTPAKPPEPYIVFDHVSKSFGDLHVLDDVSFAVMTGETLCILGRSGVGKSVSLQQIMGFLKPDKGRILIAGEDITNFSDAQMDEVRKKVTMVFQSGALFDSLSVG
jgi:phospholipid/cholesterol/gamma-HCH transport system ATP-binding protein